MPTRNSADPAPPALLWDHSLLWGVMLRRAMHHLGLSCELVRSEDIARGYLRSRSPTALLVPGGWASRKLRSLGDRGASAIASYVRSGGFYFGICGGAGMTLTGSPESTLGLCPWGRKPMHRRLPNCSGHVRLRIAEPRAAATSRERSILAPVWWPSQFDPVPRANVRVLASYLEPASDFWVADLPVQDLTEAQIAAWEESYRINLHPDRIRNDPAIILGSAGRGRYLLSYVHLESPGSAEANRWFCWLLGEFAGSGPPLHETWHWDLQEPPVAWEDPTLLQVESVLRQIVQAGQERGLFCWRTSWLLGWSRGVPGFALNALLALTSEALQSAPDDRAASRWKELERELLARAWQFRDLFLDYMDRHLVGDTGLEQRREKLVGPFPWQGGLFGRMADMLQEQVWLLHRP
jgi:hypothetical protein